MADTESVKMTRFNIEGSHSGGQVQRRKTEKDSVVEIQEGVSNMNTAVVFL